ncbi:glycosyltransferase [Robertkochia solimangrovi]|uniref:glycosyltransferase n=1 Tax=Robertkochia solimangrovi TaxID=2213046 RepID=UPI00117E3A0A|nr:glycosyltransferase [Robertkochia solimangrovi]TRZ44983.1 hypothetical protein DMZ48_04270 [Robertkochia solimangrovi]
MTKVIYILPDVDAGVTSIVRNLLKFRDKTAGINYKVILTREIERNSNHVDYKLDADEQHVLTYSKYENLYAVFNRLKREIQSPEDIIVANDGLELRMINALGIKNRVVYIIHGDFEYYYGLIRKYGGIIDKIIAYSSEIEVKVNKLVADLNFSIEVELNYYPVPEIEIKKDFERSIDLLFVGTFVKRKGVQYLLQIYQKLRSENVHFNLHLVGGGELEKELFDAFRNEKSVVFHGLLSNDKVIEIMKMSKVLLFPSLSEGLPNVLVEAMKAGCVPISHDLPSGVHDLIDHGVTGYIVNIGAIDEFSAYAESLLLNQNIREDISVRTSSKMNDMFEPFENAKKYEKTILGTSGKKIKVYNKINEGGFLNKPFMPNFFVKVIRRLKLNSKL